MRSGTNSLLIDAGISAKDLAGRLSRIGVGSDSIDALVLSHEHVDHVRGAVTLSRRHAVPVFANRSTSAESGLLSALPREMVIDFNTGSPFSVGCIELVPFAVPHDAEEAVGFTISDGRVRIGFATDLGSITLEVVNGLSGCDAVVLESNHDEAMLMEGPYPQFLKRRVGSPYGHLSNTDAAELINCFRHDGLSHLVLAHISRTNNHPDLPLKAAKRALGKRGSGVVVSVGRQFEAGELIIL